MLSEESFRDFRDFRQRVETEMRPAGAFESIADWGNKLAGQVARIAGVLHLFIHCQGGQPWNTPIAGDTMRAAIRIGEYFWEHAKIAFGMMGADPALGNAQHVLAWIERKAERYNITAFGKQEAWQDLRGRFEKVAPLNSALEILTERGFIRGVPNATKLPGRPKEVFEINPLYLKSLKPPKKADFEPQEETAEWTG
jgi:replicative DNA helicase